MFDCRCDLADVANGLHSCSHGRCPEVSPPSEASRFMNSLPVPAKQENPLGSSPALAPVTLGNQSPVTLGNQRTKVFPVGKR